MNNRKTIKLLKPEVSKAVYDLGWKGFRLIQEKSIKDVVETDNDIIISAPTAGGKTEAAFLPTISESSPQINNCIKIIYISPLKALINDQLLRIENLCKYLNCKITKWHGDASQSKKIKMLNNPSGILLTTPESLESFLINRSTLIYDLFKDVDYYIIDEVHNFVGGPRGDQLKSILNRLDNIINKRPRRILLSATIGSLENYKVWLNNPSPIFIEDKNEDRGLRGSIQFFETTKKPDYFNELTRISSRGKNLIFGNGKGHLEETCSQLKSINKKHSNNIDIHHGSLSTEQREFVENKLRVESNLSVFCTNTLELGIDIGDINKVGLISPPWSVSSFIQKIGRSGREEGSKIDFRFFLIGPPEDEPSHIGYELRIGLIQSIALVELMLEGWCEPGSAQTNSYSTFAHQLMAYLAQRRTCKRGDIWNHVAQKSFSDKISESDLNEIIENLLEKDYINEDSRGHLFLGNRGDKLTEHYDFYSIFFTPKEWSIHTKSKKLGTIPLKNIFKKGDAILFSGKKWKIELVNYTNKVLQVTEAESGKPPKFFGNGGTIHKKIHQKMKEIYKRNVEYKYLTDESSKFLNYARNNYEFLMESEKFLPLFTGSGVCKLAAFVLESNGYDCKDMEVGLYLYDTDKTNALKLLKEIKNRDQVNSLLENVPVEELHFEKYDHLLPKSVLRKSFINSIFDLENYFNYFKMI